MKFFVHNGYSGWSYGTPSNPQLISENDAIELMRIAGLVIDEVSISMPPAQFAEENSELYKLFCSNRFLQYGNISDCMDINKNKISEPMHIEWNAV